MISRVKLVSIPVRDQQRAVEFYTTKLGFEVRRNEPMTPEASWVEVAPPGADTTIAIVPPPEGQPAGDRQTGIGLQTTEIDALHADLKAAGVDVDDEVSRQGDPVPPLFWFRDPDGNVLMVVDVSGAPA